MTEDETRAIFWFADGYHSGQWSRLYRLKCIAMCRCYRIGWPKDRDLYALPLGWRGTQLYARLEASYANDNR